MNHGAIVDALKTLTSRIHLRGKSVAMAVSGNAAIIKRLTIPHMEGAALDEQMEWEVQQNIPYAREEVFVDHTVLVEQTPEGQMEVLLAAAKKEIVEQYMHVIQDAGLQVDVIDTAAFAVQNAVESSVGFAPGETVAVINVGSTFSTLNIVSNGMPVFTRDVTAAGNTYTESIQQRLAVSLEGAEAYKVGGASAAGADVVPQEVHRILAQVSEQVAGEFQRSLDFYVSDAVDAHLSRIILTGGTALVPQLPKAVQDAGSHSGSHPRSLRPSGGRRTPFRHQLPQGERAHRGRGLRTGAAPGGGRPMNFASLLHCVNATRVVAGRGGENR